jgi:AcrR family transcriptional regulator
MDRARTEQALEDAALRLLEREGVLSGLNLQKVADEAGVNRGLVYHYFGSRRDLLRKALRRNVMAWGAHIGTFLELSPRERTRAFLRGMIQYPRTAKLVLLLAIDGDRTFRMIDARPSDARGDADYPHGVDADALTTIMTSCVFAYAVRRTTFARELGVPVKELDGRVEETLLRLIDGLG